MYNAEAHADMYNNQYIFSIEKIYQKIVAYPAAIYRCFVFDDDSKVAKFRSVKDKAFSKRLSLYNTSPTPP